MVWNVLALAAWIGFGIWLGRRRFELIRSLSRPQKVWLATLLLFLSPVPPLLVLLANRSSVASDALNPVIVAELILSGFAMVAAQVLSARLLIQILSSDVTGGTATSSQHAESDSQKTS